jgi:hypothetical protein
MRIGTIFAVLALVVLTTSLGFAQTRALEPFHYPPTTLIGLGSASNGFSGPWVASGNGTEGLVSICNTRFDYANLSYEVKHDTMHLQWVKSNAWSDANRYKRGLATTRPNTAGQKVWLSYLVDFADSLPVGNTYFMIKLYSGTKELVALGHGGGGNTPATWTCGSGWPGNSGEDISTSQITGDPAWVVMRMDMTGNSTTPCRTYMWVDPNPAVEPDTATAIVKRSTTEVPVAGIDTIAIEFGGDGIRTRLIFDEIVVGANYAALNAASPTGALARESFNYPVTTLIGKGTAVNGFGGPWVASGNGTEGLVTICNNRFDYANLSYEIPHDTIHLQWLKSNAWSDANRYKRGLAAAWPNTAGTKYWLSYLVDFQDSLPVGNTYFMIKLYSGTKELVALGHGGGGNTPATWTCGSGWPGNSGEDISTSQITGDPAWVVMRIDMTGNTTTPCRTYMWVDPNPAVQPDTATAIVKRSTTEVPVAGIDTIAIEFGGDGIETRLIFDEICFSPTYAGLTVTDVAENPGIPTQFELSQNYPNPFNPSTNITYALVKSEQVRLSVFNILGQEVAVLVNSVQNPGQYTVTFNGNGLTTGVYFYRLQSASNMSTMKMMMIK